MDIFGWLILGLFAGAISGWFVGTRSVSGCLPTVVVGIVGAVIGGWIVHQMGFGQAQGFIAALVVAILGSVVVRLVLRALETR